MYCERQFSVCAVEVQGSHTTSTANCNKPIEATKTGSLELIPRILRPYIRMADRTELAVSNGIAWFKSYKLTGPYDDQETTCTIRYLSQNIRSA